MADIRPFKRKESGQHGTGEAFCISCGHTWIAVAQTGITALECPECHAHKGRYKFEFAPSEGQMMRACNCGNQLFYLTPDAHMCANCGLFQRY